MSTIGGRACALLGGSVWCLATALPALAAAQDLVYMEGVSLSTAAAPVPSDAQQLVQFGRAEICANPDLALDAMAALDDRMQPLLALGDPAAVNDLQLKAGAAAFDGLNRLCSEDDGGVTVGFFRIIYASCRMTMYQGDAVVDMRLPPGGSQAYFDLIDYDGRQVVTQPVDVAGILASTVEQGRSGGSLTATGKSQLYVTTALEEDTDEFTFNTSFVMDLGGMMSSFLEGPGGDQVTLQQLSMLDQIMGTPIITSSGSAWIAPNAPGADTVRAFYENFAAALQSGQGSSALMSGLFNHFLLREGLPLEMTETTRMDMGSLLAGVPGAIGANAIPMPGAETTQTNIERILVRPMPSGYCSTSIVPDGFAVLNPLAGLNSGNPGSPGANPPASSGANAAGGASGANRANSASALSGAAGTAPGGASSPDADAAMKEINAAMANMTDEQKAAMQQLGGGFGALLGGALSGQGAALPGTQAPPSTAAPGAPARAATGPSSADLMTNDLTESTQNLLRALGYDPGPSDGDVSTETVIAISQFQAERGLDVTGEVTPQLVGILAAQVDER